ncbi:MAG: glutathione S-transferase family protein [Rhodobacteraceae bacterium]|nr:glutathione S-transferase family protein [Paracoccaceae bacterium]
MLEVIGSHRSRAFRVLWMLEELGEPYRHTAAKPHSPEVLRYNPSGKIPLLIVDDAVITDSVAILHFLADRSARMTFPAGSLERAEQDGWTHRILDELDACLWTAAKHSFVFPEEWRREEIKPALKWEFAGAVSRVAERMEDGPFLMGAGVTVPDILLTHCLSWARIAKFEHSEAKVENYFDRLRARAAYRKAAAL